MTGWLWKYTSIIVKFCGKVLCDNKNFTTTSDVYKILKVECFKIVELFSRSIINIRDPIFNSTINNFGQNQQSQSTKRQLEYTKSISLPSFDQSSRRPKRGDYATRYICHYLSNIGHPTQRYPKILRYRYTPVSLQNLRSKSEDVQGRKETNIIPRDDHAYLSPFHGILATPRE